MAVVLSGGQVEGTTGAPAAWTDRRVALYGEYFADYASIYRTQPAVRTVHDFLARNIAQLGLHAFRRRGDNDRQRLRDHPLPRLINRPNPRTTRYRAIDALVHDFALYDDAFWLKLRQADQRAVVRLPPSMVRPEGATLLGATSYELIGTTGRVTVGPEELVHFRGYNPTSTAGGLSPMETLRRVLAEDVASGEYREKFWLNAARHEGVLSRPAGAPAWSDTARRRFREEFEALYTGPLSSGRTAILEEGMTFTPTSFSAKDSQYLEARKLTREEVAAAYHIPPPLVGILDHATFSNIQEQHKQLYSDTLGPWLVMIAEELELQLLPDVPDTADCYLEFNLAEKLRGSFEEQAEHLRTSVGAPWLTRNEARARSNLPALPGGDELITPLNVAVDPNGAPPATDVATVV